ncbi:MULTISPECIES: DUF397 domain-containing protein [Nonomuraea]|uniref:DUF397 domain-containing protein n=1 Tax=Nonomuraea guangzhouensis TaxID=1291555 RepID=A0ABW4GB62_9ACTN|nr:DUF397 domain-containing protein [Nonomuraea guangzhouensis]
MSDTPSIDNDGAVLVWRKSRFSNASGDCVEVATLPGGGAAVRDSKDPQGLHLRFSASEWVAFVDGAKAGEFDLPSA